MAKLKKDHQKKKKPEYQLTDQEKTALGKQIARIGDEPAAPRIKISNDEGRAKIILDHPETAVATGLLLEALGTANSDFANGLLGQLVNVSMQGEEINELSFNFLLSVIKGIKPRDQLEAMLAAQMAMIHLATIKFASHLPHIETLPQQDSAERALNKLARTYTTQMEALKRYRTGGEQKVTVQYVSVNDGGQAIVGNVTRAAPGSTSPNPTDAAPPITDALQTTMPMVDDVAPQPTPLQRRKKK